ncbi:MAG: class I SAM-dependent methyltransferase, partial [Pseudomonadota bacterium]
MSMVARVIGAAEKAPLPDFMLTAGVERLVASARQRHGAPDPAHDKVFAAEMAKHPIAVHPDEANRQHYEIPAAFFEKVLGPRLKYSCCRYANAQTSLAEAEAIALNETIENAGLADGQRILELGCGWGSLTLEMAERFPNASIVAVSNSSSQRAFILGRAAERGFNNLTVITADMAEFDAGGPFDRIVSIEMFEHMSNWRALLERTRSWLADDGRLFIHIFTNRGQSYRFD